MRSAGGPIVLAGLAVFAFASLGCAIAGNIQSLWLLRALQGLSAGAGLVVGRAIIRDRFQGAEAQRLMSQITLVFGVAPALAPVIGGALLNLLGWRAIFWMMMAFSRCGARLGGARAAGDAAATHAPAAASARAVAQLPGGAVARRFPAAGADSDAQLRRVLHLHRQRARRTSPMLGVTTWGFAWLFVPMIAGVMIGGFAVGQASPGALIRRPHGRGRLRGACSSAWRSTPRVVAFVPPRVPWHVLPIFVYTIGSSLMMPSVTLLLLDLFPTMRGIGFVAAGIRAVRVLGRRGGNHRAVAGPFAGGARCGHGSASACASLALWLALSRAHRLHRS